MEDLMEARINEHIGVFQKIAIDEDLKLEIKGVAEIVAQRIKKGGAVYLCGNGGSAADAQHIATEFVSRFYKERKAMNAEALTVNTSSLTAIGNDYDFDRVFERQLEAKGRPGDVLIGITTSGTSRNVIKAIEYATNNDIYTIILTGGKEVEYDKGLVENIIRVPSLDTPRIQEAHIFIGHMLAEYVEKVISEE